MKILVTGGAGFIGSHVVDAYIEAGHDVVIVDDLSSGKKGYVHPKARLYNMDIRNPEIATVFEKERPEVVNHHAAQKSVPKSVEDPILDADINIIGLLNLLQQCVRYDVRKFILASTGGALAGDAPVIPTPEDVEPVMISPYAISKFVSEKYLYFYGVTYGLDYTVLRYANVYGPRQTPEGECGVIPIFMDNIMHDRPSVLFAFDDMPKGTTRDYVYVEDLAEANVLALDRGERSIINIGSAEELYIEDIYHVIEHVIGKRVPLQKMKERAGDVRRSALDYTRAQQVLGWRPRMSLEDGIRITHESMLGSGDQHE